MLSTGRKGDMLVIRGELQVVGEDGSDEGVVLSFDATVRRVGGPPKL